MANLGEKKPYLGVWTAIRGKASILWAIKGPLLRQTLMLKRSLSSYCFHPECRTHNGGVHLHM